MIRIFPNGDRSLNQRLENEPRLTRSQREAMRSVASADLSACVKGLDTKMRPVIYARLPGPNKVTEYAILRNGDPTTVTKPMKENWR